MIKNMPYDRPFLLRSSKLYWYYNRLSRMSLAEIIFRVHRAISARLQHLGAYTLHSIPKPNITNTSFQKYVAVPRGIDTQQTINRADSIVHGDYAFFMLDGQGVFKILEWNRDPLTGIVGRLSFGKTLDYRDEKAVGDIKYLWEPNRHIHLTWLAQGYAINQNKIYLSEIRRHLTSWFEQCPYLFGANWSSSLEASIRLINWSLVWQWIGGLRSDIFEGQEGKLFRDHWLVSVYQHVHFIRGFYSKYSSANNHLIGELAGVFIATLTWPYWPKFVSWGKQAEVLLQQQALKQNGRDGVNREQAISYQQFVVDFLLLSGLAARANNISFSDEYWSRIELMLEYIASIMDVAGNVPMIGDADDGYVVKLSGTEDDSPYHSLLATGSILFGRADFKNKAGDLDEKSLWLLGDKGWDIWDSLDTESVTSLPRTIFTEAGYFIMGCNYETENELRIVADAGPLGYLSIAAHGHCDALAFTLSFGGDEFLIDPGTYAYHTEQKWRQYFRGTSAHNTVRIDGQEQSVSGGNFMWLRHAQARCTKFERLEEVDTWVAEHDGYLRLADPLVHERHIELNKLNLSCVVKDSFRCRRDHAVERFWHFSEKCNVDLSGNRVSAMLHDKTIDIEFNEPDSELEVLYGDPRRPSGWISRRFGVKQPTTTLVVRNRIPGSYTLSAHITCKRLV